MVTPSTIYWIGRLGEIRSFFYFISGASIVVMVVAVVVGIFMRCEYNHDTVGWQVGARLHRRLLPAACVAFLASSLAACFTPTPSQAAAMLAIPAASGGQDLRDMDGGLRKLAAEWLHDLSRKTGE